MTNKVLSYNIHHGADGAQKYKLEATCAAIKALGADIIGVQEIDRNWSERSNWEDQVTILSGALGMEFAFAASIELPPTDLGRPNRQFGNGLFSKYPILSPQVHHMYINDDPSMVYDGTRETEPRSILEAKIDLGEKKISVLCTHLSVHSQKERLRQTDKVERLIGKSSGPLILLGDLNASSDSEELVKLRRILADPSFGKGLVTKPNEKRQIDYILIRDLEASQIQTIESNASDHLPLLANLTLG
jgi:endonuclease/exonuclease/phosphatase family metal-dependent hydrolase